MTKKEKMKAASAYLQGYIDGLSSFAWWKDGVQYVGTCGTTLQKAIDDVKTDPKFFSSLYRELRKKEADNG